MIKINIPAATVQPVEEAVRDNRKRIMNLLTWIVFSRTGLGVIFCLAFFPLAFSMQPPRPGEVEQYRADGSLAKRLAFGRQMANYRIQPELIQRNLLQRQALQTGATMDQVILPYPAGLPATGSPRIFVLLIDFPDYPHYNAESAFSHKLFGTGDEEDQPYESLTEYYRRSSYGALNIQGAVLPWYRAQHNRSYYTSDSAGLIKEALEHYRNSYDFSIYDNNGDGKIDFFSVFWTGPDTGWNSFWWAWCDMNGEGFRNDTFTIDGKRLGVFMWQWESNPILTEFMPRVTIHETGHGLGLPDYYDYDEKVGPRGGLGGLDMMDANRGDHNAFSKWMLGWITPTVIGDSDHMYTLKMRPSSMYADSIVIMPGQSLADPFSEYFIVQNRSRREPSVSNDYDLPTDGLIIWHVDAQLNATSDNFAADNSYTPNKLLRLMEADGREHIEQGYIADEYDYYTANRWFSRISTPSSDAYSLHHTGVSVINMQSMLPLLGTPVSTFRANFIISSIPRIGVGESVDNTTLNWAVGGSESGMTWYGQQQTYMAGGDSARNTTVGHGQYASMAATATGPASLRFNWKVSSQENHDYLQFSIDGIVQESISGEVDWHQKTYAIAEGEHYLMWKYVKDASGAAGSDCGWVDKVECSLVSLGEALDNSLLNWVTGGASDWLGQAPVYYYGGSAAQSGSVGPGQNSLMYTTATGPGTLSFYWKVSSFQNGAFLDLYIDSQLQERISGEVDWQLKKYTLDEGNHTVAWQYVKTGSQAAGEDCGWVDHVVFGNPSLGSGVDFPQTPWVSTGDVDWAYVRYIAHDGIDAVRATLTTDLQEAILQTVVVGPGTASFYWMENDAVNKGDMVFRIDGDYKSALSDSDWIKNIYPIPAGAHILSWNYELWGSGTDSAYVDQFEFIPDQLTLGEALDNSSIPWETYGPQNWFPQQKEYAYGLDAAQSGDIADSYGTYLETTIYGPGTLQYDWKVSSEQDHDFFEFYIDDRFVAKISGEVDWETRQLLLPKGAHAIRWQYYKNSSISSGKDCCWLDHVILIPNPPLGEALDNMGLQWSTGGSADWMGERMVSYFGGSAARSGGIQPNQSTELSTTVTGPGVIKFRWKVSSQYYWDKLEFLVDGTPRADIDGIVDWTFFNYNIDSGTHSIVWRYSKDKTFTDNEDCGWLDKVEYEILDDSSANRPWLLYE